MIQAPVLAGLNRAARRPRGGYRQDAVQGKASIAQFHSGTLRVETKDADAVLSRRKIAGDLRNLIPGYELRLKLRQPRSDKDSVLRDDGRAGGDQRQEKDHRTRSRGHDHQGKNYT